MRLSIAIQAGNYVRFFQLARGATFVQACAIHRNFEDARRMALQTMKASSPQTKSGLKMGMDVECMQPLQPLGLCYSGFLAAFPFFLFQVASVPRARSSV